MSAQTAQMPGERAVSQSTGAWTQISVERLSGTAPPEWDARLCGRTDGSWRQSTHYGEYKRQFYNEEPVYLVARCGDRIVAQLLAFFTHPYGWSLYRRDASFLAPLCQTLAPWFYCLEGPVVFADEFYAEAHRALYGWLVEEAMGRGCIGGSAIPSYYAESYPAQRASLREVMAEQGFDRHDKATLVVDLAPEPDELFANLKKEARNKVRRAEKQAIEIVELRDDPESLERLYRAMDETARRNGVAPVSMRMLRQSSWTHCYDRDLSRGFASLASGQLLSTQMAVAFNGILSLGGVSYTDYSRANKLYGNDLVQWHIIRWGRENGYRLVDFSGIAPRAASEKLQAIHAFKAKWGGQRVEYDHFTVDLPTLRGKVSRLLVDKLGASLKRWDRRWRR